MVIRLQRTVKAEGPRRRRKLASNTRLCPMSAAARLACVPECVESLLNLVHRVRLGDARALLHGGLGWTVTGAIGDENYRQGRTFLQPIKQFWSRDVGH